MRGLHGNRKTRAGARTDAFTLIELMVVAGMLAILMSLAAGGLGAARAQARVARANAEVRELVNAWLSYEAEQDDWPTDIQEGDEIEATKDHLTELIGEGDDKTMVYLNAPIVNGAFRDPWGTPYKFRVLKDKTEHKVTDEFIMSVSFPNRHRYFR